MAITSRTAAARIEQENRASSTVDANTNIADSTDPFFFDFGYGEDIVGKADSDMLLTLLHEGLSDSPSNMHQLPLPFDDIPSPVPLRDIVKQEKNGNENTFVQTKPIVGGKELSKLRKFKNKSRTRVKNKPSAYEVSEGEDDNDINDDRHVRIPKPEDVLSVRGVGHSKNPGNLKFRELVYSKKSAYENNACPNFRRSLAVDIVAQLRPGRFLKKEDITQRVYKVMDYDASITKALFAVRDVKMSAVINSKRKIPSSTSQVGERKKRQKAASKQQKKNDAMNNDKAVDTITTKRGRPKRRASQIAQAVIQQVTRRETAADSINFLPQPSCLTNDEIEDIEDYIEDSITFRTNIYAASGADRPTRSGQIHHRIEELVAEGAEARKGKSVEGVDSIASNDDWFKPDRQREVRLELLTRCRAAMETGMSFGEFFDQLRESVTV